jgi:hypothetical protein
MDHLDTGIENMLRTCAGLRKDQSLLIIGEAAGEDYYDASLVPHVARVGQALGLRVQTQRLPFTSHPEAPPPEVMEAMRRADATVFLSRRGDQLRFDPVMAESAAVICYALDREMMASPFGRVDHRAMIALMEALNRALEGAARIRVTCPLGTDFEGPGAQFPTAAGEVTIRRFPLSVFSPIPAGEYAGTIAMAGFVPGSGRTYYTPHHLPLKDVLRVRFNGTRITGFDGPDAERAIAHFDRVGELLGIDPRYLHSWHAGMHPGCGYDRPSWESPARWGGGAFGNPRMLHFHACGAFAPGEISLNVIDPTIWLGDVAVWEAGRLHPERVAGGAEVLAQYPGLAAAFADPAREMGLTQEGQPSALPDVRELVENPV